MTKRLNPRRLTIALIIISCLSTIPVQTTEGMIRGDKRHCRPCGPEHLRGIWKWLIPQGAGGADFRAACLRHDQCYATPGACKQACDRQFLMDMLSASSHARWHRRSVRVARRMYHAVDKHGDRAFLRAQMKAAESNASAGFASASPSH